MSRAEAAQISIGVQDVSRERLKELRATAKKLLYNYSNRIPKEIVSGKQVGKYERYKVQKNWFNSAGLVFTRAARRKELDESLLADYESLGHMLKKLQSADATKQEVEQVDRMLKKLVKYCNRRLGLRWYHYLLGMG